MNPLTTFATFFKAGGPFMYPIFVLAVVIVAIAAERWWLLMVKSRISLCLSAHSVVELPAGTLDETGTTKGDQLELEKYEDPAA